ncbi:hypothetical protein TNCT_602111 [Trichonephila clavata]|uniref:Uncharacterized protein n=1 Tax=Trichonephila clavata TaxID=2740835 RepID=A0A8X6HJA5_TRICU|nr:hypothetical protein TNCT_602111 [Trichonephila clavata]
MAYGALHAPIVEPVIQLLAKPCISFYKKKEPISKRLKSLCPLADGHKSEVEVYTTSVVIRLEERVIRTQLIILPYAKGNRTLLGMDFLQKAGIVLNLRHRKLVSLVTHPIEPTILLKKQLFKKSKADLTLRKIHAYCVMMKVNV